MNLVKLILLLTALLAIIGGPTLPAHASARDERAVCDLTTEEMRVVCKLQHTARGYVYRVSFLSGFNRAKFITFRSSPTGEPGTWVPTQGSGRHQMIETELFYFNLKYIEIETSN